MGNRYERSVELGYAFGPVFDAAMWAAAARKGTKVNQVDHAHGVIVAYTKTSFWSWGEQIIVTVTPLNPTRTRVNVLSKLSIPFAFIDWGLNARNVDKVMNDLAERLTQVPPLDMSKVDAPTSIP